MKKIFLVLLAFGLLQSAHAQFGVRAGYSSANFEDTNFRNKSGFHVGGYYRADVGFFSIEPGLQFAQKGYETNDGQSGAKIDEKLSYVDVPVLFRLNFLPSLNVFAGPQGSILVSRKYTDGTDTNTSTEIIRGYDIAGVVGLGVSLPWGINAQASYDFGLTSLNYFDTNVNNRVFKLSVGWDFY
ncbi:porin family protein [Algoriphagus sediminis]|uniref:Porin family protein n=1 Tax=Algoriphagus sediminis TaxID=3057113 RepID=A0ABT7Y972_9BACT|nr:porin family protein [Algoriphagus sediminis]MDN3203042.1 porin family protein [Algoriphagus sediminis]